MKRTKEPLIEDIEYHTKWAGHYTKLDERLTKKAEEARKELKELEEQENEKN